MCSSTSKKSRMEEGSHSQEVDDEFQKLMEDLPLERNWDGILRLYKYQNFWCPYLILKDVVSLQKNFEARHTDIFLTSLPKSGTTWSKSILFSICNRHVYKVKDSPLLSCSPHELVLSIEYDLYLKNVNPNLPDFVSSLSSPRLLATHIPYESLPASIRTSKCKIVYICRNPVDCFISTWHFINKFPHGSTTEEPLEEAFQWFCKGIHVYGPYWDHLLGYWKASLETPDKVLFIKYEDMKKEPVIYVKMLAQFIGKPFSDEEEKEGIIEDIVRLCSFENMKNLEVNKKGERPSGAPNSAYFRKGEVGDGVNFLKPNQVQQLEKIVNEKLKNSGLNFNTNLPLL